MDETDKEAKNVFIWDCLQSSILREGQYYKTFYSCNQSLL